MNQAVGDGRCALSGRSSFPRIIVVTAVNLVGGNILLAREVPADASEYHNPYDTPGKDSCDTQ